MGARAVVCLFVLLTAGLLGAGAAHADVVWLCKPGLANDPCVTPMDTTVQETGAAAHVETPQKPATAPVDCFYVYPTTSNQPTVNANKARDPELLAIAKFQAARFGLDCRIYAPVYRQMTLVGLETASVAQKAAAFKIAYADVREAWHDYLDHDNQGRGVVLLGHSQGTRMLRQLIHDDIDPQPAVREHIVSSVLLGGNVLVRKGSDRGGDFQHVPACRSEQQYGCVIAFSTFNYGPPDNTRFGRSPTIDPGTGLPFGADYEVLCTNPASLGQNERKPLTTLLPGTAFPPLIGVFLIQLFGGLQPSASTTWVQPADRYNGRCETHNGANVFFIASIGAARKLNPSPDSTWGQHLADMNIALGELVSVVARQSASYLIKDVKPAVAVRLTKVNGCRLRVSLAGADVARIARLDVRAGDRLIARDRRPPFRVSFKRLRVVHITVVLADGRRVATTRRLAAHC